MSQSCSLACPYCSKSISYRIWFNHILTQHKSNLFDDSPSGVYNRQALVFRDTRSTLPTLKFPKVEGSRYVCWSCKGCYNKESSAQPHLAHLKASLVVATEIKDSFQTSSTSNSETPPLGQVQEITNQEAVAFQRVILNITEELEDALWYKAKYEALCDNDEMYASIKRYWEENDEPKEVKYDIASENKKESKVVDLSRSKLQKARDTKL